MKVKITAVGHLGRECSVKIINGVNAISFSMAVTEKYKNKEGVLIDNTTWLECTLWRKPEHSTVAQYLKKGQLVMVEGRPEVKAYKSREGEARASLTIRIDELLLLGGSKSAAPGAEGLATAADNPGGADFVPKTNTPEEDLPF